MPVSDLSSLVIPMLLAAATAQGLFLTIVLVATRQPYRPGRTMLAGLMASLTLSIVCQLLSVTGLYASVLPWYLVLSGMPFLIGPFLYLSLQRFTGVPGFRPRELVHYLPFALNLVSLGGLWVVAEPELRSQLASTAPQEGLPLYPILKTLVLSAYGVAALVRLGRSVAQLREQRSSFAKINLLWLKNLIGGYLALLGVLLLAQVLPMLLGIPLVAADTVLTLVMGGLVYGMGYFWMKYPVILAKEEVAALGAPVRYRDSNLRPDQAETYRDRLVTLLRTQEPYLDPELTLGQLADQLRIPAHHLSQVINEQLGQNFFELVNQWRIEKAKVLLADPKRTTTILEIAFEVGFNSKATFNRAFKKQVSLTPSQYQASVG